jgi:hypothetical protein
MKYERLLRSILDESLYEQLNKALTKLSTSSVVDIGEVYHSLKVAPKAVLSFLSRALRGMDDKSPKEIPLPWSNNATLSITKQASDVYKGHIVEDGQITHEFTLTSLPALAAHLTSHFELYDDKSDSRDADSSISDRLDRLESKLHSLQLQALEAKVNELIAVSSRKTSKSEGLEKGGLMPTMPQPPKGGANINQTPTKTGIKGMRTAATDRMSKPAAQVANKPELTIKPQKLKTITFNKSDVNSKCLECGEDELDKSGLYKGCSCWKGLSRPTIKKSDSNSVTLEFRPDWDDDDLVALVRSVYKYE